MKTYKGNVPKANYYYLFSEKVDNRRWDIYVDTTSNPNFHIHWKVILARGRKRGKANYLLTFSITINRLIKTNELDRFSKDFPSKLSKKIENISRWIKGNKKEEETLPYLGEGEGPCILSLSTFMWSSPWKKNCRFVNGTEWKVGYNIERGERFIMWCFTKKTDTPLYPDWDTLFLGMKQYDSVDIAYSIDRDETFFLGGERDKRVFLKYCLPEHFKYFRPFSQYLFYKLKENGLIN